jgi:RHS repeat-associated protein
VTYGYDLNNRLTSTSDTSAAIASAVPPGGASVSYGTNTTYDALNRPIDVNWTPAPAATAPAASSSVLFQHQYNSMNQRTNQAVNDNTWISYPSGPAATTSYTVNALNQYTTVGAVSPTYDGNGIYALGYDAENRLTSASGAGNTASYTFDGRGRRKSKTVNGTTSISITDADNREVLEYDGSSGAILNWYVYGLGANDVLNRMEVGAATRTTFVPDLLGSIVATMDSGTATLSKVGYLPYGSGSVSAPFGYTGQRVDNESGGLYYYRARHYSPVLGRFLQPDPIGNAGGINLYVYVGNDPLNQTDSLGLAPDQSSMDAAASTGTRSAFVGPAIAVGTTQAGATAALTTIAVAGAAFTVGMIAFPSSTSAIDTCGAGQCEQNPQYVVRGGISTAQMFQNGSGVTIDANGNLQGVSVQTFPNTSVQELSQQLPQRQIGVSSIAAINSMNGTIVPDPTANNPYHAIMGGITPETAERLFTPTIPNPNPRINR